MSKRSKVSRRFLLACVIFGTTLGYAQFASAEQRVALVIGNSAYPTARLRNPVNDAKAMADKLRALGFDVILRTDVNLRDMTRSFSQFGQKLVPGSVSLFYYAGHGMQVQGKNFLIPVDAEIESEASVRTEAVDVDQLLYQLGPARLSMVILDACRNNPFERRFRSTGSGGLAQIDAPTGTLLAYATAPGKVASDGTGSNGLYTEALLKALGMPGLKVEDVFKQVRINVVKVSDGQQTPWESSSLTGEFYFTPDNKAAVADDKLKQSEKERTELARALDEERKKRDKDAEAVRHEMEKLRAELLKLKESAAPAFATAKSAPEPQVASVSPQRPTQAALASPASTAASPAATGAPASQAAITSPQQPTQVALASPSAPATGSAPFAAEWTQRIALLEKTRGQLTFSKAVAILLDMSAADELSLLLTHEAEIKRMNWQSAYALGTDDKGNVIWGGGWRWRRPMHATDTALTNCAGAARVSCKVVMINGEFREKDFLEVAKQLGGQNVAVVRQAYLQSLRNTPPISSAISNTGMSGPPPMGFSSIRD